jgi:hypothetical protein
MHNDGKAFLVGAMAMYFPIKDEWQRRKTAVEQAEIIQKFNKIQTEITDGVLNARDKDETTTIDAVLEQVAADFLTAKKLRTEVDVAAGRVEDTEFVLWEKQFNGDQS